MSLKYSFIIVELKKKKFGKIMKGHYSFVTLVAEITKPSLIGPDPRAQRAQLALKTLLGLF